MVEVDSKYTILERLHKIQYELFEIILDFRYNKQMEIRQLSKGIQFAESVKLNFSN